MQGYLEGQGRHNIVEETVMATNTTLRKPIKGTPTPKPTQGRSPKSITGVGGNTKSRASIATRALDKEIPTTMGMSDSITRPTGLTKITSTNLGRSSLKGTTLSKARRNAKKTGKKKLSIGRMYLS
jgi:hypothetical protein